MASAVQYSVPAAYQDGQDANRDADGAALRAVFQIGTELRRG